MTDTCLIWGGDAKYLPRTGDFWAVESERAGGRYEITGSAVTAIAELDYSLKARLTTWLINQHVAGISNPRITTDVLDMAAKLAPLSPRRRADRTLRYLAEQARLLGERTRIYHSGAEALLAWSESVELAEVLFLLDILEDQQNIRLSKLMGVTDAQVLVRGYERLEEIANANAERTQGFVAMWFDASMEGIFKDGIVPGIRDAGYEPMRIDRKQHNNKIDDEIIAEIRRSRFLVADFTHGDAGARGGVYYEAGFAHGLSIPVIFSIRSDMSAHAHFDTRQYSHILWSDAADLRKQLADRISATLGDGPA